MQLERLLKLQLLYCLLGILFNLISWFMLFQETKALTPTDPGAGIIVMSVYGLFLISGKMRKRSLYRILMGLAVAIFIYGGLIKHIIGLNQSPEVYYSLVTGLVAIGINLFGLVLNSLAALEKFT